jgi:glutathione S-transferase
MITVHHLNNSRSQRVLWLLEELGVPHEIKHYQRDAATMLAPPELRAIHPLGKSPVITDGDNTLAETGAIVEYLIENYGEGRLIPPKKSKDRLRYTYWMHYAEGSAMPPLLMKLIFSVLPGRSPSLVRPLVKSIADRAQQGFVDPQIDAHMAFWEAELGKSEWFAGDQLTGADIMMSFPAEGAARRFGLNGRPRIKAFLDKIHARPAYVKALERGGPYALL